MHITHHRNQHEKQTGIITFCGCNEWIQFWLCKRITLSKERVMSCQRWACLTTLHGTITSWTVPLQPHSLTVQNVIWLSKGCKQFFAETHIPQRWTRRNRQWGNYSRSRVGMSRTHVVVMWDYRYRVEAECSPASWRLYIWRTCNRFRTGNCHWAGETVSDSVQHTLSCTNERLVIRVHPEIISRPIQRCRLHTGYADFCWCVVCSSLFCTQNTSQQWICRFNIHSHVTNLYLLTDEAIRAHLQLFHFYTAVIYPALDYASQVWHYAFPSVHPITVSGIDTDTSWYTIFTMWHYAYARY